MNIKNTSSTENKANLFRLVLFFILINIAGKITADEDQSRLYSTREEKREAGVRHEITPWLIAYGLAELEGDWQRFTLRSNGGDDHLNNNSASVQIGFDVIPTDWLRSEILTEYDTDTDQINLDEATLAIEKNAWEIVFGKQVLDFGVYYSHFVSGPILEFGETNAHSVTLAYSHHDKLDLTASVYRGDVHKQNSNDRLEWSAAFEAWPTDNLSIGMSFLSDLADSDAHLLKGSGNSYKNKTPALSGYLLWVEEYFEISLEALGAIRKFRELDADQNQPMAWNIEYVYFLSPEVDWSIRLEGSMDLEDEPELQTGIAMNYRLHKNIYLTTEVLYGLFKGDLATDDNGRAYDSVITAAALLNIAF